MGQKVFASAVGFLPVTKSDSTLVNCKGIYVGGAGDLYVSASNSATPVAFINIPAGSILPIELKQGRIMSTSTTTTSMVILDW